MPRAPLADDVAHTGGRGQALYRTLTRPHFERFRSYLMCHGPRHSIMVRICHTHCVQRVDPHVV